MKNRGNKLKFMLVGKMKIWGKVREINRICEASNTTTMDEANGMLGKCFSLKSKRQLKVAQSLQFVAKTQNQKKSFGKSHKMGGNISLLMCFVGFS